METTKYLDLIKFYEYKDFLQECQNKVYDSSLVLHRHHVIPRCFKTDRAEVVQLSVEDHIHAHILLSKCFTEGSYEQISNLRAAKLLQKKSIKYRQELEKLYEHSKGPNSTFWKKTHSEATRAVLSLKTSQNLTNMSYEEIYGFDADIEKDKRRQGVRAYYESIGNRRSEETRAKMKANAKPRVGAENGMAKKVEVNGKTYNCLKDAIQDTGLSTYLLKKLETFKYI